MNDKLPIAVDRDVLLVRKLGRERARAIGLGRADQTRLATAISELARNVLRYAGTGTCTFLQDHPTPSQVRLQVVIEDNGPGIPDVERAMEDGFSTGNGLGAGLPGTRRLVHEFALQSRPGFTRITIGMVGRSSKMSKGA